VDSEHECVVLCCIVVGVSRSGRQRVGSTLHGRSVGASRPSAQIGLVQGRERQDVHTFTGTVNWWRLQRRQSNDPEDLKIDGCYKEEHAQRGTAMEDDKTRTQAGRGLHLGQHQGFDVSNELDDDPKGASLRIRPNR